MRIGLTYDLKEDYLKMGLSPEEAAEFDSIETIDAIERVLQDMGFSTERLGNAYSLLEMLGKAKRWELVFNICEGLHGAGREAQVPAILELFNIPYVFSDVLCLSLSLHKGMCKHVVRDHAIPTADFQVIRSVSEGSKIKLPYPLFVKPVAEGTGKGISPGSFVENESQLKLQLEYLLETFRQEVLVEVYLPGREFTAGLIGSNDDSRCIGVMEVNFKRTHAANTYSFENKLEYQHHVYYTKPEAEVIRKCEEVALASWKALGCRDGGRVDLRMDAGGTPNFIEVNPLAGLHPEHSDLPILARMFGMDYKSLIRNMVFSALNRYQLKAPNYEKC
ncbi:MAG: D-alanine--D-alanine ligase [Bacteroidota bacterium]|nr:D-alanine--D-alanine ligase [Bacteroidota bacterium]